MGRVLGISHVAYIVTDLDQAVDFYCRYLNFKKVFGIKIPENIDEIIPGTPLSAIIGKESLVYLQAEDGSYIELFHPLPCDDPASAGPNYHRMGYVHLSLQVDDLDSLVEELKENGVTVDKEKNWVRIIHTRSGSRIRTEIE